MTGGARSRLLAAGLLLAVAALYVAGAAGRMVLDVDEALYIAAGDGMARTGDLVTPCVNGVRFLDKPPLLYWTVAGLERLLGRSELAVHLPPVLAVLATTGLLVWIGATGVGTSGGLAAGAAFAFSVGTYLFTRETLPDGLLIACIALAMAAALAFRLGRLGGATAGAIFGAALAGGLLAKGLLGLLFPLATLALARLVDPERRPIPARHAVLAIAACLLLAVPWHLAVAYRNPGFFAHAIVNEQVMRFFGRREPVDVVSIPLPLFWALLLLWLLPWTVFLPAAALGARQALRRDDPRGVVTRLGASWAAVVLGFFSVSARLEHYAFAGLPPLFLLVGLVLAKEPEPGPAGRAVRGGFRALGWLGAALLAMGVGVGALAFLQVSRLGAGGARPDRAYDTDFGPLAGLPQDLRRQLLPVAAVTLAALGLSCLLARRLEARGRRGAALVALCGGVCAFGLMADRSLRACEDVISSRRFGTALARTAGPRDRLLVLGDFETANSIAFYAPQRIELVGGQAPTLAYGLTLPGAPRLVGPQRELVSTWSGAGRVFLLADKDRLPGLGLASAALVAESADRVLVANR